MDLNNIKRFFASKVPFMKLLPTQEYGWNVPNTAKRKRVIPKKPTTRQLRNFSRDPIVRRAITVVQDALARQEYKIDVIGGRGKYLKQIQVIQNIIEHPNIVDSKESLFKKVLDDAMVLDAMAVEVAKCSDNEHPIYLYPVDGSSIQQVVPYNYQDPNSARYSQQQPDGMHYYSAKDLAYLQRNYFTYQPFGLSPVEQSFQYIRYYLNAIEQANDRAVNATSEFLISLGDDVNEKQRQAFEDYFRDSIEGTGKVPIAAGAKNIETKQIRAINADGLYLQWQERLTQIVGAAFGIPPEKLGLVIANDRSTGDDQEAFMVQELIKPYATMLENLINNYVIANMGLGGVLRFHFLFEESENQKGKKSTRLVNEYYRSAITENEFRKMMGYDESTSEYADMTYVQKSAQINVDLGIAGNGGFNGVGNIKDTSNESNRKSDYDTEKQEGGNNK